MSETHPNAYALELQEKRQQRDALNGEIAQLEAIVEPPKEVKEKPVPKRKVKISKPKVSAKSKAKK